MRRLASLVVVSLLVAACGSSTPSGPPAASGAASSPAASAGSVAPGSPTASTGQGASLAPGGSAAPGGSEAPGVSSAPGAGATPAASTAPVASSPPPSASTDCPAINDAIATIDLHMQLMEGMDASMWAALTDPAAGSGFDIATFKAAVKTVSAYPGTKTLATDLTEIARLMDVTQKTPRPFASGSRPGLLLAAAVTRYFTPVGRAMQDLRAAQGCPAA